ncbi:MAG: hypothetical protein AB1791_16215 [Chloroflexota bacterium]
MTVSFNFPSSTKTNRPDQTGRATAILRPDSISWLLGGANGPQPAGRTNWLSVGFDSRVGQAVGLSFSLPAPV